MATQGSQPTALPPQVGAALRELARPVLARPLSPTVRALSAGDWETLCSRAAQADVAVWVHGHITGAALPVPAQALAKLAKAHGLSVRRRLEAERAIQLITPLLLGPLPPAMQIKGAVVERLAYPPNTLRPQGDVDLLVRPGAEATVLGFLRQLGMPQVAKSRSGHVVQYLHEDTGVSFDVHLRLVCPLRFAPWQSPASVDDWFATAVPTPNGLAPEVNRHTAFLLVHLVEAIYTDLRHIADAAQWLATQHPNAHGVATHLANWQATRAGLAGLAATVAFAPELQDTPLGAWLAERTANRAGPQAYLATKLRQRALRNWHAAGGAPNWWLEGLGIGAHLDQPWRWAGSFTPACRWLGLPRANRQAAGPTASSNTPGG